MRRPDALFIDVDNVLGGLPGNDPKAAMATAGRPSVRIHRPAAWRGADAPSLLAAH